DLLERKEPRRGAGAQRFFPIPSLCASAPQRENPPPAGASFPLYSTTRMRPRSAISPLARPRLSPTDQKTPNSFLLKGPSIFRNDFAQRCGVPPKKVTP